MTPGNPGVGVTADPRRERRAGTSDANVIPSRPSPAAEQLLHGGEGLHCPVQSSLASKQEAGEGPLRCAALPSFPSPNGIVRPLVVASHLSSPPPSPLHLHHQASCLLALPTQDHAGPRRLRQLAPIGGATATAALIATPPPGAAVPVSLGLLARQATEALSLARSSTRRRRLARQPGSGPVPPQAGTGRHGVG